MTVEIRKQFRFEAAHILPFHLGKCASLHGHSYRLDVAVAGEPQTTGPATGMVADFDEIGAVVRPRIIDRLDHASLNDLIENPTAERIAIWVWNEIAEHLPQLVEIVVWETQTACAIVRGDDARAR